MVPPGDLGGVRGSRPRLRGDVKPKAGVASPTAATWTTPLKNAQPDTAIATAPVKKRVLFVCIGNSCRSQMAEAFARAYGSDILEVRSAGLSPASIVAPLTKQVLAERNISAEDQFPKGLELLAGEKFDVVINLSGYPIPALAPRTDAWPVPDPIGQKESVYRDCAARIEALVMRLILELRAA